MKHRLSRKNASASLAMALILLFWACAIPQDDDEDLGLGFRTPQPGDPFFGTASSVDVFILAGQSNGVGLGDPGLAPMNAADAFVAYDSQGGGWKPQGMANPALYADPVPGRANWSPNGSLRGRAVAIAKDGLVTLAYNGVGYAVKGVIWVQGESDALLIDDGKETSGDYEARLREIIAYFRQSFGGSLTFGLVRTGTLVGGDDACFAQVRAVQDKICGDTAGVPMLYRDADKFPDLGWMTDMIHYSQTGLNAIGRAAAAIFGAL